MEAPPGIGPGMKVLQTSALPLGYGAIPAKQSVPYFRPRVKAFLLDHREKFLFVNRADAQRLGFIQLGARILPGNYQ